MLFCTGLYSNCNSNIKKYQEFLDIIIVDVNTQVNEHIGMLKNKSIQNSYYNDNSTKLKFKFQNKDAKTKYIKSLNKVLIKSLKFVNKKNINNTYLDTSNIVINLGTCTAGITSDISKALANNIIDPMNIDTTINSYTTTISTALSCTNILLESLSKSFELSGLLKEHMCYKQTILDPMKEKVNNIYINRWIKDTSKYFTEYNNFLYSKNRSKYSRGLIPSDVEWRYKYNDTKATENHKLKIAKQMAECTKRELFAKIINKTSVKQKIENIYNNHFSDLITERFEITCTKQDPH
jgi:predicted amino acid-binding ACT domain protein